MKSEDPQVPQMPDPAEDNLASETAPSQPPESLPEEGTPTTSSEPAASEGISDAASIQAREEDDDLSEIRRSLLGEDLVRRTGNLIRRFSGSLRRLTGPLPPLPTPPKEPKSTEQPAAPVESAEGTGALLLSHEPLPAQEILGEGPAEPGTGPLPVIDEPPSAPALSEPVLSIEPQPEESLPPAPPAEAAPVRPTSAAPKPEDSDYVSEIRQSLQTEKTETKSGGLIRRITGSLRRVTGPLLKRTGSLPQAPAEPEPPALEQPEVPIQPTEVADNFLSGRLAGASAEEPATRLPEEGFPEDWFATEQKEEFVDDSDSLEALFAREAEETAESSSLLSELGLPAEPEAEDAEPDWVAEMRQGKVEEVPPQIAPSTPSTPEPSAQEPPAEEKPSRGSGPLSFITGILRRSEQRKPRQTGSLSDEMVSGRVERSLGTGTGASEAPAQEPPAAPEAPASELPKQEEEISFDDLFYGDTGMLKIQTGALGTPSEPVELHTGPLFAEEVPEAGEGTAPLFAEEEFAVDQNATLLEDLESRFGQFGEETGEPGIGAPVEAGPETKEQETALPDISAELWTEEQAAEETGVPLEGITFTPEDVWGEEELPAPPQPGSRSTGMTIEDALAASFLTGEEVLPDAGPAFSQDQLLREALERAGDEGEGEAPSIEEMRAIALQGYLEPEIAVEPVVEAPTPEEAAEKAAQEAEDAEAEKARIAAAEVTAAAVEEFEREEQKGAPFSLLRWFQSRTPVQKFLIIEAAVVALALVVAIPLFIYLIARGPVQKEVAVNYPSPRSLPAELPYPTGVQLPGGWHFELQKSTFVKGKWSPITSEWLEGTELRRVVALPWNPQTQAVVNTFQKGDKVQVDLSNGDKMTYTVDQVSQVVANDTTILDDRSPSLVIILYQEKSTERWVVFCKP